MDNSYTTSYPCCENGVQQEICERPAGVALGRQAACDTGWLKRRLLDVQTFHKKFTNLSSPL